MKSERTSKLTRDLVEFLPIRYMEFREYAKDGPSLHSLHLNGLSDRTGTWKASSADPRRPISSDLLEAHPDALRYIASDDPRLVAKASDSDGPVLSWIPGKPSLEPLVGLTVLRHQRPQGVGLFRELFGMGDKSELRI